MNGDLLIGSSGTLVAAALETVGYYYQSVLIDSLAVRPDGSPSALMTIGAFLYLVGMFSGIVQFIMMGNYKFSAWLLLGPTIFFAVVLGRTETQGSAWLFGDYERSQEHVNARAADTLDELYSGDIGQLNTAYSPKVSSLFAWYNAMISTVVNRISAVIIQNKENMDMQFIVRNQIYWSVRSARVMSPQLQSLIHAGLLGQCHALINSGRKLQSLFTTPAEKEHYRVQYLKLANTRSVVLTPDMQEYLLQLAEDHPGLFSEELITKASDEVQLILGPNNFAMFCPIDSDNCEMHDPEELKTKKFTMEDGEKLEFFKAPVKAVTNYEEVEDYAKTEIFGRIEKIRQMRENAERLERGELFTANVTGRAILGGGGVYSCHQIWQLVYALLHKEGKIALDRAMNDGAQNGLEPLITLGAFTKLFDEDAISEENFNLSENTQLIREAEEKVISAIAKSLLDNEVAYGSPQAILGRYITKVRRVNRINTSQANDIVAQERFRLERERGARKTSLMLTASNLPYYQGLLLYFLSVLFPFFAMLLLIPGKHSGFVLWFGLWFWAKSWDIGYSIVMMLDDVMHAIFMVTSNDLTADPNRSLNSSFSVVATSLTEVDPSFNPTTYYAVIGAALMAIPVVFGYIVLGALQGGSGIIAESMQRQLYGRFGNSINAGLFKGTAAATGGLTNYNAKMNYNNNIMKTVDDYFMTDLGGKAGSNSKLGTGDKVNYLANMLTSGREKSLAGYTEDAKFHTVQRGFFRGFLTSGKASHGGHPTWGKDPGSNMFVNMAMRSKKPALIDKNSPGNMTLKGNRPQHNRLQPSHLINSYLNAMAYSKYRYALTERDIAMSYVIADAIAMEESAVFQGHYSLENQELVASISEGEGILIPTVTQTDLGGTQMAADRAREFAEVERKWAEKEVGYNTTQEVIDGVGKTIAPLIRRSVPD